MSRIEQAHRAAYMGVGLGAHYIDLNKPNEASTPETKDKEGPFLLFMFQDAPAFEKSKRLLTDLNNRFGNLDLRIGVALSIYPWQTVYDENGNFPYDKGHIFEFVDAAGEIGTHVFFVVSAMHWNEVGRNPSPLLRYSAARPENRMKYTNGDYVPRVLQPPANIMPSFMRGLFNTDRNGVLYLSYTAPEVQYYRRRNLEQVAQVISDASKLLGNKFIGMSIENEIDDVGSWIAGDKKTDWGVPEREKARIIREVLETNVGIFKSYGIKNIFTNQSTEDAEKRISPLESAVIDGAHIGYTSWKTGNQPLYDVADYLATKHGKKWALIITNPLSFSVETNRRELQSAIDLNPYVVGIFNWYPHYPGYVVRGMPIERAIKQLRPPNL